MNWTEIAKELGLVGIASGLVVWLIKQLGQSFIDKRFKAYELELKYKSDDYTHQLNKSLESHRTELNIMYAKASKLHDHRLEIIAELYKRLVNLDVAMNIMTVEWKLGTGDKQKDEDDESKRIENAGNSYNEFQNYYTEKKIFFTTQTCQLLDKLRAEYYDSLWDYTAKRRFGFTDYKLNYENAKKSSKAVKELIPPVLRQLESDFRIMIGVEYETKEKTTNA